MGARAEVTLRNGRPEDAEAVQEVEIDAGRRFLETGMDEVAGDPPDDVDVLVEAAGTGRLVVALDAGRVVGFLRMEEMDDEAHLAQVSVRRALQGRGIGRALIEEACRWAGTHGYRSVSLTTFSDVAWNRPLYEHLGFEVVPPDRLGPQLAARRRQETDHGLDPSRRVCMIRQL